MTVLMINGSLHEFGCTHKAIQIVSDALEKEGIQTEELWIGADSVANCTGCNSCWKSGRCVIDDRVNHLKKRLQNFDGMIIGSPVYYAGPTGSLCSFLNRLFYSSYREVSGKPGAAVVVCRRGGATAAFDRLNKYFTIMNMPVVSSRYWNQIHGFRDPEELIKDHEGVQTLRILGQNMAYFIRCKEAAKQMQHTEPGLEKKILTNFIR